MWLIIISSKYCGVKVLWLASNCSLYSAEAVDMHTCACVIIIPNIFPANISYYTVCSFLARTHSHVASPELWVCVPVPCMFPSLSPIPQPEQYELEVAGRKRRETMKVCAVVLDCIR